MYFATFATLQTSRNIVVECKTRMNIIRLSRRLYGGMAPLVMINLFHSARAAIMKAIELRKLKMLGEQNSEYEKYFESGTLQSSKRIE